MDCYINLAKKGTPLCVILPICPKVPPWTDFHQILHSCRSRGHNHLWQIFSDWLRDVDSVGVKNKGFPLTKPMAVNTGLRNFAACDLVPSHQMFHFTVAL